jgi:Fe-S cluster assembly ATPase SufC
MNTLETKSNDDYCLIENLNQLKKVLDETSSGKTLASTQKVNNAIRRIWQNKHSRMLYSHSSITDFDVKYE